MIDISLQDFAAKCAVTPHAVRKQIHAGKFENAAFKQAGKWRINIQDPEAVAYCERRTGRKPSNDAGGDEPRVPPAIAAEHLDMSLRQIIRRFGSVAVFRDWLLAAHKIVKIEKDQVAIQTKRGKLIRKDLVQSGIIDPIEGAFVKLLNDAPRTIVADVEDVLGAGMEREKAIEAVQRRMGEHLDTVKATLVMNLVLATEDAAETTLPQDEEDESDNRQ